MTATRRDVMDLLNTKSEVSGCAASTTSRRWSMALISSLLLLINCLLPNMVLAQGGGGHSATLTWTAPVDPNSSSFTYNVYRANAVCPTSGLGTLTFTKVNSTSISALTYIDSTISAGNWCYYVTSNYNGAESVPSNTAGGQARPGTVTIQIVVQ